MNNLLKRIGSIWKPATFQGWGRRRNYFEGWYFKLVDRDGLHPMALIPGIAWDSEGRGEAFLQILDGRSTETTYIPFPVDEFRPAYPEFGLTLDRHRFGQHGIELNGAGWSGALSFSDQYLWPVSPVSPGIMGWYAFVPAMECYHGIVAFDSSVSGQLSRNGERLDFDGGRAYLEKDWGSSFPSSWIWTQTNSFEQSGISVKVSVARIPWLTGAFVGFIGGLLVEKNLYRFTTYTGAKLVAVRVQDDLVNIVLRDRKYELELLAHRAGGGELAAPVRGLMEGRVQETLSAEIDVCLTESGSGHRIFEGRGKHGGLEVAGPFEELIPG